MDLETAESSVTHTPHTDCAQKHIQEVAAL